MAKIIIGLHGQAGSGKSTVANIISSWFKTECFAFAEPIKNGLSAMFGLDKELMDDQDFKKSDLPGFPGVTVRHALQTIGTEWGRTYIDPDVWVKLLKLRVEQSTVNVVVVTDLRFENEAEAVREMGGKIIHIRTPGAERMEHISENPLEVKGGDYSIQNDFDGLHKLGLTVWGIFELIMEEQSNAEEDSNSHNSSIV